jgi:F-type H+-transporting ATPase subunit delta
MKDRKVATRYARALLGALPDAAGKSLADDFLSALAAAIRDQADVRGFLLDPAVPAAAKKAMLARVAEGRGLPARLTNFLDILVSNGRLAALPSIAELFHLEREGSQGEVTATLTAARALTPELQARAAAALSKISGRKVNLKFEIDPTLRGGAVAQIGSMVYDGSLKSQLGRLRRRMEEA